MVQRRSQYGLPQGVPSATPAADPSLPLTATTVLPSVPVPPSVVANDRPLNVNDALGYLDEVKNKFQDRPDAYSHFLDIMKDFREQALTTPQVIDRVSMLFSGHPELISGFNTFLPPGYRIECARDDSQLITVTTPWGSLTKNTTGILTTQPNNAPLMPSSGITDGYVRMAEPDSFTGGHHPSGSHVPALQSQPQPEPAPSPPRQPAAPVDVAKPPHNPSMAAVASNDQVPLAALNPHSTTASAASVLGGMHRVKTHPGFVHPAQPPGPLYPSLPQAQVPPVGQAQAQPVVPATALVTHSSPPTATELNYAVQYVNHIKTRFADDPETYKKFLEILQTYQEEQCLLRDVYTQVTQLFRGAPDLIEEFKMFLPEVDAGAIATTG